MGISYCFYNPLPFFIQKSKQTHVSPSSKLRIYAANKTNFGSERPIFTCSYPSSKAMAILMGAAGMTLISLVGSAHAADSSIFNEPSNALSLPTWAVHVSSVVEWITAMALVWQYGEKSGYETWKGLSWGMVPLLGGAFCACTWHFFYNSESLECLVTLIVASQWKEGVWVIGLGLYSVASVITPLLQNKKVLVALQAALTVIGNATMCIAAFRIYTSSQEQTKDL